MTAKEGTIFIFLCLAITALVIIVAINNNSPASNECALTKAEFEQIKQSHESMQDSNSTYQVLVGERR